MMTPWMRRLSTSTAAVDATGVPIVMRRETPRMCYADRLWRAAT